MSEWDVTITFTVRSGTQDDAFEEGVSIAESVADNFPNVSSYVEVSEPVEVKEEKRGCIDFSKMTPGQFDQFLKEIHLSDS